MPISKQHYCILASGEDAALYRLSAGDFSVTISDYGATLVSMFLPDGKGGSVDVLLGPRDPLANAPYFGASVGRVANRIALGRFSLGGQEYRLAANDGANHLHGGKRGFDKQLWSTETYEEEGRPRIRLSRRSPSGEEGYPGNLEVRAIFGLSENGELDIRYEAKTDAATVVNLTNHAYFNLAGNGEGDILGHKLKLSCSRYLKSGSDLVPTGEVAEVAGGPFDFRRGKLIGADIEKVDGGSAGHGYDHCFVVDRSGPGLIRFAELEDPASGRKMVASTTLPSVQFYSGNFLSGEQGKGGMTYGKHSGLCLETQFYPDAPNQPAFPSIVLRPGESWSHRTVFSFKA
jgi:aldose 1-epimerase